MQFHLVSGRQLHMDTQERDTEPVECETNKDGNNSKQQLLMEKHENNVCTLTFSNDKPSSTVCICMWWAEERVFDKIILSSPKRHPLMSLSIHGDNRNKGAQKLIQKHVHYKIQGSSSRSLAEWASQRLVLGELRHRLLLVKPSQNIASRHLGQSLRAPTVPLRCMPSQAKRVKFHIQAKGQLVPSCSSTISSCLSLRFSLRRDQG